MRVPDVQFSVRGFLIAVAISAVLMSNLQAVGCMLSTLAVWLSLPIIAVVLLDTVVGSRAAAVASMLMVGTATRLLGGSYFRYWDIPFWTNLCLTPVNLGGPLYVAMGLWRGKKLVAGEILWGWAGSTWIMLGVTPHFHRMHSGHMGMLEIMVQAAQLTLALTLGLALFGRRPIRPNPLWPHYFGWGVVEGDIMAWGWYA